MPQYCAMTPPEIAINIALLEPLQCHEPMEATAFALPLEENPEFLKCHLTGCMIT